MSCKRILLQTPSSELKLDAEIRHEFTDSIDFDSILLSHFFFQVKKRHPDHDMVPTASLLNPNSPLSSSSSSSSSPAVSPDKVNKDSGSKSKNTSQVISSTKNKSLGWLSRACCCRPCGGGSGGRPSEAKVPAAAADVPARQKQHHQYLCWFHDTWNEGSKRFFIQAVIIWMVLCLPGNIVTLVLHHKLSHSGDQSDQVQTNITSFQQELDEEQLQPQIDNVSRDMALIDFSEQTCPCLTKHFAIFKPLNLLVNVSERRKIRRLADFYDCDIVCEMLG